jgi:hypothetical protein
MVQDIVLAPRLPFRIAVVMSRTEWRIVCRKIRDLAKLIY